jgi:hypothetical protein
MKLEGIQNGTLYCSNGRAVLEENGTGALARTSTLPVGLGGLASPQQVITGSGASSALGWLVGRYLTTNVWKFDDDTGLATLGRQVFATDDAGETWTASRQLPDSSALRGVLQSGVCRHEGALYLGEYPLDESATPRILRSTDGGTTWQTAARLPDVRHVHAVQSDPYGDDLWVTTGDRDEECRVGRLVDGEIDVVGGGSQRWRTVELAFTPSAVLWGMDCVFADENALLRLDRGALDEQTPDPETVGTAPTSVYHATTLPVDDEHWVVFSTAGETSTDSTVTGDQTEFDDVRLHVLGASSTSAYTDWHRLATYRKRRCLSDIVSLGGTLPRANAYAFLAADPRRGLFVNPYNAVPGDGELQQFSPADFAELADG